MDDYNSLFPTMGSCFLTLTLRMLAVLTCSLACILTLSTPFFCLLDRFEFTSILQNGILVKPDDVKSMRISLRALERSK